MAEGAPIIIDIEASGFASEAYPIEVGLVLEDGKTYCSLIAQPEEWTYWDDEAEKVHRVARDILETYGRPIEEVAGTLNEMLNGKTAYSDGWEVDNPWLSSLFWKAEMAKSFRFSTLEMIISDNQFKTWHDAKDSVLEEMDANRHRASLDAVVIQKTYMRTKA